MLLVFVEYEATARRQFIEREQRIVLSIVIAA